MAILNFHRDIEPLRQDKRLRTTIDFLGRIDEEFGEPSQGMKDVDPRIAAVAQNQAEQIARTLRKRIARAYALSEKGQWDGPLLPRNGLKFRRRLLGEDLRHARQAATLAHLTGALNEDAPLHVYDACGGNGVLSSGIAFLRKDRETSGLVVDRDPENCLRFALTRRFLAKDSDLGIEIKDVRQVPLVKRGGKTICAAKHACGPAAEMILRNISQRKPGECPDKTVILTCCHGALRNTPPPREMSRRDWRQLVGLADVRASFRGQAKEIEVAARFAMQLVDSIRVAQLPDHLHGSVQVAFEPELSVKNHALVITPA